MNTEDKIKIIGMKLYIQLHLLENDILKRIKIKYDEKKINFLQIHFKKFYYRFTDHFIIITKFENNSKFEINFCNKNLNPCKFNNQTKKYQIFILFKYLNNQKKKIHIPINLFEFECSKNNVKILNSFTKKIENKLKKDNFLKKIIHNVSVIEVK